MRKIGPDSWGVLTIVSALAVILIEPRWLIVTGLTLDMIGAVLVCVPFVVTRQQAAEAEDLEEIPELKIFTQKLRQELPETPTRVADRLKHSSAAAWGIVLLVVGFGLQILGNLIWS